MTKKRTKKINRECDQLLEDVAAFVAPLNEMMEKMLADAEAKKTEPPLHSNN